MNGNTPWRTTRGNRLMALASGQADWYRISATAKEGRGQVHIYDEIGFLGKSAQEFIHDLETVEGPFDLHINSPGGEVFDGVAIYNTLLARDDVHVYIDGIAASIASVIAMAGDEIYIAPTAQLMVHNAFAMACGDADDMRSMADHLERNTKNIAGIYAARSGLTADHWLKLMSKESWFTGQEAVDAGLADKVIPMKTSSKTFDLAPLAKGKMAARAGVVPKTEDAAHHPYHGHFDIQHEPMTGVHSHNHACFGCGDGDDGIHAHAHMHNGDAVHGHEHVMHDHDHMHDDVHRHAHDEGLDNYGPHSHTHAHHAYDPDHDGDDDSSASGDTDHDYVLPNGSPGPRASWALVGHEYDIFAKDKYTQADRDRMAASGEAMADGSYPIADGDDLDKAIHAVGRGKKNSHEAIRKHIIKRARALKQESKIPDTWTESGSASDSTKTTIYSEADAAALAGLLRG